MGVFEPFEPEGFVAGSAEDFTTVRHCTGILGYPHRRYLQNQICK